jgi:CTD kinase subunit gamma
VLKSLQSKGHLESQAVVQILDVIKERENTSDDFGVSSPNGDVDMTDIPPSQTIPRPERKGPPQRLEKRQIEQRIEEDRERHKRERESIWAVPAGPDAEMGKLWDETSDYGEDDDRLLAEEARDHEVEMEMQGCQHQQKTNGNRH